MPLQGIILVLSNPMRSETPSETGHYSEILELENVILYPLHFKTDEPLITLSPKTQNKKQADDPKPPASLPPRRYPIGTFPVVERAISLQPRPPHGLPGAGLGVHKFVQGLIRTLPWV